LQKYAWLQRQQAERILPDPRRWDEPAQLPVCVPGASTRRRGASLAQIALELGGNKTNLRPLMSKKNRAQHSARSAVRPAVSSARMDAGGGARFASADWILWLCFFGSGMTALVYEVLWTRMITNVIGGAPFAVAIVLTIFMGGIGLGSHLAGRIVDQQESAGALVRLYGRLELLIAGFALIVPLAVMGLKPVYGWIYHRLFDHFLLYNLLVFARLTHRLHLPNLPCPSTSRSRGCSTGQRRPRTRRPDLRTSWNATVKATKLTWQ
jgi:hypothetical protein